MPTKCCLLVMAQWILTCLSCSGGLLKTYNPKYLTDRPTNITLESGLLHSFMQRPVHPSFGRVKPIADGDVEIWVDGYKNGVAKNIKGLPKPYILSVRP